MTDYQPDEADVYVALDAYHAAAYDDLTVEGAVRNVLRAVLPAFEARIRQEERDAHTRTMIAAAQHPEMIKRGEEMKARFAAKLRKQWEDEIDAYVEIAQERQLTRVAAQALRDAANDVEAHRPWDGTLTRTIVKEWMRERADQIEASGTEREADK